MAEEREAERRAELAAFLRARRAAVKPADVGIPEGLGRRRTPGLRREEVAQLSGVGIAWYTWLEQGRVVATSTQVIDAISKALLLDDEAHRHLRALAGLPLPVLAPDKPLPDAVHRMVDNLLPNPAYVVDRRFDFHVWNDAYRRVWRDLDQVEPCHRNLIWLFFTDPSLRDLVADWTARAEVLTAQFRLLTGRHAGDARLVQLVDELTATSPLFREWWSRY